MRFASYVFAALVAATPALAEGFDQIESRDTFLSVISDKNLTRFGINVTVTPSGKIAGRAFGRDVSGDWRWKSGYFCRDLYWGSRNLGANCQAVKVDGRAVRFISDRGTGDHADLTIQ